MTSVRRTAAPRRGPAAVPRRQHFAGCETRTEAGSYSRFFLLAISASAHQLAGESSARMDCRGLSARASPWEEGRRAKPREGQTARGPSAGPRIAGYELRQLATNPLHFVG